MTMEDTQTEQARAGQSGHESHLPVLGLIEGLERVCAPDTSAEAFVEEILRGFVALSEALYGAFWAGHPARGAVGLARELMPQVSEPAAQAWRPALAELATGVVEQGIIRYRSVPEPQDRVMTGQNFTALGFAVKGDAAASGCITVVVRSDNPILSDAGLALLRLMADFGLVYGYCRAASRYEGFYKSLSSSWDIVGELLAFTKPVDMAQVLANAARKAFGAERVSVGFVKREKATVTAISGEDKVDKRSNVVRAVQAAQTEIAVSGEAGYYGEVEDPQERSELATRNPQQERLAHLSGARSVYSVPLRKDKDIVAVMTVELGTAPVEDRARQIIDVTAGQVGPMLALAQENQRGVLKRAQDACTAAAKWVFGKEHPWRKAALAAGAALLAFAVFGRVDFNVRGSCELQPAFRSIYAAPFDATIKAAPVQPGDTLNVGDVVFELDGEELELRLREARSNRAAAEKEMGTFLAEQRMSQYAEAKARAEALAAEIELLELRLGRTRVRAEFPGIVLTGDLRRELGRPVRMGEKLVEVAPLDRFVLELKVEQGDVAHVAPGQEGAFTAKARPGVSIPFTVEKVRPVPEIRDRDSFYIAEASVPNPEGWLRPGMEGAARVHAGRGNVIRVYSRKLVNWIRMRVWW